MENQIISGRYRFLQKLGEGGFSQTFLAEDLHLPTKPRCVVKQLKPQFGDAESIALANRLFEQEAEVLYRLGNHPNIPQLLAHFEEAGEFYLVQELIEGNTLAQELAGGKVLDFAGTIKIVGQILETLAFVHGQNVIHRDIKPANLIRRQADGRIFLIDFGAVKQVSAATSSENSTCQSTVTIGSQGFMPSEQMAGKPRYASDLYALGLVAIEMLTGISATKLKQNPNTGEFVWQHKAPLPAEIENFITKLVRYDFRQRYVSAKEALAALNMIAVNLGIFKNNISNAPVARTPLPVSTAPAASAPRPLAPSVITKIPQLPPTIIAPPTAHFRPTVETETSGGVFGWIWNNDIALGVFVAALVFGFFIVGGYVLIKGAVSSADKAETQRQNEMSDAPPEKFDDSLNAFQEAMTQANEAETKAKKATTKFEWKEVGNKFARAHTLLASIQQTSQNYAAAQEKIAVFKQRSENAFQNAELVVDKASPNSLTVTTTTGTPTNTPNPYSAATPEPIITMPPKQSQRTYLSYNYLGYNKAENKVITPNDANFTSSVEKQSDNQRDSGLIRIRADGGSYSSASLTLKAPTGMKLGAGSYQSVQEYPWQSPTMYAMSFDKLNCSQNGNRSFTINSIVYDSVGTSIVLLDATFNVDCGTNKAKGRIRYDARQ